MRLATLMQKGALKRVATATPATEKMISPRTVATVAVATLQDSVDSTSLEQINGNEADNNQLPVPPDILHWCYLVAETLPVDGRTLAERFFEEADYPAIRQGVYSIESVRIDLLRWYAEGRLAFLTHDLMN